MGLDCLTCDPEEPGPCPLPSSAPRWVYLQNTCRVYVRNIWVLDYTIAAMMPSTPITMYGSPNLGLQGSWSWFGKEIGGGGDLVLMNGNFQCCIQWINVFHQKNKINLLSKTPYSCNIKVCVQDFIEDCL